MIKEKRIHDVGEEKYVTLQVGNRKVVMTLALYRVTWGKSCKLSEPLCSSL